MTPLAAFQISLQTALSWGWIVLAFAASAGALAFLYGRMFRLYPRRQALILVGLKWAAVAMLLVGLLRPSLVREEKDLESARVIVLVDDSQSMAIRDGRLSQPRSEDARRAAFETLIPALKDQLSVAPMSFSTTVQTLDKSTTLTASGDGTDIPNAIAESARSLGGNARAGAFVVISDGGDSSVVPATFSAGAPVFTLAIGTDLSQSDDLAIEHVEAPQRADVKTDFEVSVDVALTGNADFLRAAKNAKLTLMEGDQPLQSLPLDLGERGGRKTLRFRISAGESGIHRYALKLPRFDTEAAPLNNERSFAVEVNDPSLRVLYHAARLGQGYKPFRNALKSDPGVQITSLVRVGSDRFLLQGQKPTDTIQNEFPTAPEALQPFKVIVLADTQAQEMSPSGLAALEQFVARGGALVVLGGPQSFGLGGWSATPLGAMLPWQVAPSEPAYREEKVAVELTPIGQAHPIFRDLGASLSANGSLATLDGLNTPGPLRPGAQALLLAALPSGERPAVIAFSRHGKGKVLGIATAALWKWSGNGPSGSGPDGGKLFSAFWRQTIRFLGGSEDGGGLLNLSADRQGRYAPGARATVTARVMDRAQQPLKNATLSASLKRLDGTAIQPVQFREDGPPGAYSAQVDLPASASYRLQVTAADATGVLESRELLLETGGGSGEGLHAAVNMGYLQELANKTGGAAFTQDKADALASKVLAAVKAETRRRETSLVWDSPFFFMLFLGLMTAEWVMRRWMNLL